MTLRKILKVAGCSDWTQWMIKCCDVAGMVSINNLTVISVYRVFMIIEKVTLITKSRTQSVDITNVMTAALYRLSAPLPAAGGVRLGAGRAVRAAPRHQALGQIHRHGERHEVGR